MTFFNIFSKQKESNGNINSSSKKKNSENKNSVIIDIHEKNSLLPSELSRLGIEYKFEPLKVGDYIVNGTAIERKTISDLKSSIISKRIMRQLNEIKQYEKYILLVEGNRDDLFNNILLHGNAVRGFLLSVSLNFKIPIIFSSDEKDSARYISILLKKEKKDYSIRASKIARTIEEQVQFVLEGFPGVGAKTSKKLISKFGSVKNVVNASLDELEKEIGKKAHQLFEILNRKI